MLSNLASLLKDCVVILSQQDHSIIKICFLSSRLEVFQNVDNQEGKMMLWMKFVVELEGEGKTILSMKFVVEFERQYLLTVSCCVEIDSSSRYDFFCRDQIQIIISQPCRD